jgi:AcrR family transcriptional regulator
MESNRSGHGAGADGAAAPPLLARASQRERLMHGMARAVAEQGYAATSVADVLAGAGVSRRTFYEQFADKEDCFLVAYDAFAEACEQRAAAAYRSAAEPREALARAVTALLDALAAEPDFARLAVVEILAAGPHAVARRDATLQRFVDCIDAAREEIPSAVAPPPVVAEAIAGGMYELLYRRIAQGQTERMPELSGELLRFAFMLLGVEPPSAGAS